MVRTFNFIRGFLAFLLVIFSEIVFSQTIFTVDNFSKDYYGKIQIDDTSEVFSKGWVAIYETKTNKQLIKVVSNELAFSLTEGELLANIKELPYGEQSLIMYDDFNFDGKKDFAISDGQNSCYHGPSFKIYLAAGNGFIYNKDFTRLSQEYCGMFNIDARTKRIFTMTKSGCCWHEYSEFAVVNNKPRAVKIQSEELGMLYVTYIEETWNGKSMVKKTTRKMDWQQDGLEQIFSFNIPKNNKQVVLFLANSTILYYALIQKDSTIEFLFPTADANQSTGFQFNNAMNSLTVSFKNKNAVYKVYERPNEIGIAITVNGKTTNWIGDLNSKKGSLEKLKKEKPENVK